MTTSTTTLTATHALPLRAGTWSLDPLRSRLDFTIRHLGVSKVRGSFTDLDANLVVGDTLADTSVTGLVWTESIDTGISRRDDHIRSRSIVDVQRRPAMTFRSSSIVETDDRWLLEGEVTVAGVTKPVHLDVELVGVDCVEDGRQHARLKARGEVRRDAFELAFARFVELGLSQVVKIEVDLHLVEPPWDTEEI